MELTGTVIHVNELKSGEGKRGKTWKSQEFVIQFKDGIYDKKCMLTLINDKTELCPSIGDAVKVLFNIDCREYNDKWYNDLTAWKVEVLAESNDLPF